MAAYPFTTRDPNVGVAGVPDPRIDAIADAQDIPNRVQAQVEVVDIAGLSEGAGQGEGLGGAALGRIRELEATVHVLRGFANAEVPHPLEREVDPLADARAVDDELMLADAGQVERRMEKVQKGVRAGDADAKAEAAALEAITAQLESGLPVRTMADDDAIAVGRAMGLLTAKPVLYLVNTDDPGDPPVEIAEYAAEQGAQALTLPVGVELELAEMRERIAELRLKLAAGLQQATRKQDFSFMTGQIGMFSFSGLTAKQAVRLREEFGIYIVESGRINVAGLNASNLPRVCAAIAEVL